MTTLPRSNSVPNSPANPILVALDTPDLERAHLLAQTLAPHVGGFKVGLELWCAQGPRAVEALGAERVFLDLKLHDIPNTVAGAAKAAARLGVMILNVHCLGGRDMMRAAVEATREVSPKTKLIGVTILTSHDESDLAEIGLHETPRDAVRRLALLGREAGIDGVVCSPQEIALVRQECGGEFLIVTPGVRPSGAAIGDQKRVMTPQEALTRGADWLVAGRPITGASDPVEAARTFLDG